MSNNNVNTNKSDVHECNLPPFYDSSDDELHIKFSDAEFRKRRRVVEPSSGQNLECRLSMALPRDPVTGPDGMLHDRDAWEAWVNYAKNNANKVPKCPKTGKFLSPSIRSAIDIESPARSSPWIVGLIDGLINEGSVKAEDALAWKQRRHAMKNNPATKTNEWVFDDEEDDDETSSVNEVGVEDNNVAEAADAEEERSSDEDESEDEAEIQCGFSYEAFVGLSLGGKISDIRGTLRASRNVTSA